MQHLLSTNIFDNNSISIIKQGIWSESNEISFESIGGDSKESDYFESGTIESEKYNSLSQSFISNDDTIESKDEITSEESLFSSEVESIQSKHSIQDAFSYEKSDDVSKSQEDLTLDQTSYESGDSDISGDEGTTSNESMEKDRRLSSGSPGQS